MDILDISNEMKRICSEMDKIRKVIKKRTLEAARCESDYYKVKSVTIMKLKSGHEFELDSVKIKNPQASYITELVKGLCHVELLKKLETAGLLKSAYVQLKTLENQLSSLQSIFRHLDKA